MSRDILCPKSWTPEQKARFEAWVEGEEARDSASGLIDRVSKGGEDLTSIVEEIVAEERRDRERFGQSALPRFNPYSIPRTVDPKAVDCPYCVKRPRNLAAHCRAVHPDKPEAR